MAKDSSETWSVSAVSNTHTLVFDTPSTVLDTPSTVSETHTVVFDTPSAVFDTHSIKAHQVLPVVRGARAGERLSTFRRGLAGVDEEDGVR